MRERRLPLLIFPLPLWGYAKTHLSHCEHPKDSWQSPNFQIIERLLRRFAPRNDLERGLLTRAHQGRGMRRNQTIAKEKELA